MRLVKPSGSVSVKSTKSMLVAVGNLSNIFHLNRPIFLRDAEVGPPTNDADGDGVKDELENISVYFASPSADRYVPRAIIVDLEPGTIDVIKGSKYGNAYNDDFLLFGANGAGSNA